MAGLTFYDSVDARRLPDHTTAMAGYVDGRWPSLGAMRRRFPRALWLSIAVRPSTDAMVLDVESGDATPNSATDWVERQHRRGLSRPCLYTSLAAVPELERALRLAGIARNRVRLWTAHYTGREHICGIGCGVPMIEPPGATQHTTEPGADIDVSLTTLGWFTAVRRDYLRRQHP